MGELTDFLVWLQRKKKAGKVSHSSVQVVGYWATKYLEDQELEESKT